MVEAKTRQDQFFHRIMIKASERARMMLAHSIGPRTIELLERTGIETLGELAGTDLLELRLRIEAETGYRFNANGVQALRNLVALADGVANS
jgi:nucleotidyltransferase/DNA polymerase involved in DNA repair